MLIRRTKRRSSFERSSSVDGSRALCYQRAYFQEVTPFVRRVAVQTKCFTICVVQFTYNIVLFFYFYFYFFSRIDRRHDVCEIMEEMFEFSAGQA